jgi:hypothetical protein
LAANRSKGRTFDKQICASIVAISGLLAAVYLIFQVLQSNPLLFELNRFY